MNRVARSNAYIKTISEQKGSSGGEKKANNKPSTPKKGRKKRRPRLRRLNSVSQVPGLASAAEMVEPFEPFEPVRELKPSTGSSSSLIYNMYVTIHMATAVGMLAHTRARNTANLAPRPTVPPSV